MWGPPKKEGAPPAGNGDAPLDFIAVDNSDGSELSLLTPKKQAVLRRRSDFARAMVFEEFKYKHARAIDYGDFVDRRPNQAPRRWRAAP